MSKSCVTMWVVLPTMANSMNFSSRRSRSSRKRTPTRLMYREKYRSLRKISSMDSGVISAWRCGDLFVAHHFAVFLDNGPAQKQLDLPLFAEIQNLTGCRAALGKCPNQCVGIEDQFEIIACQEGHRLGLKGLRPRAASTMRSQFVLGDTGEPFAKRQPPIHPMGCYGLSDPATGRPGLTA